jgi:hypothetical protein
MRSPRMPPVVEPSKVIVSSFAAISQTFEVEPPSAAWTPLPMNESVVFATLITAVLRRDGRLDEELELAPEPLKLRAA